MLRDSLIVELFLKSNHSKWLLKTHYHVGPTLIATYAQVTIQLKFSNSQYARAEEIKAWHEDAVRANALSNISFAQKS